METVEQNYYYNLWMKLETLADAKKFIPEKVKVLQFVSLELFKEYCLTNGITFKYEKVPWDAVINRFYDIYLFIREDGRYQVFYSFRDLMSSLFYSTILKDPDETFIKSQVKFDYEKIKKDLYDKALAILNEFSIVDLLGFIHVNS